MASGAEQRTNPVHSGWQTLRAMQARRDALWAEYEALAQDCGDAEKGLEAMDRWAVADHRQERPLDTLAPLAPVNLDGCTNAHERLVRMAEVWGGAVDCHRAAKLLINEGISRSRHDNLVSSLQKEMASQVDTWKNMGRRIYHYLPYNDPGVDVDDDAGSGLG